MNKEGKKYGLAKIGRQWHLTHKVSRGVLRVVLTGATEEGVAQCLHAMQGEGSPNRRYGKLRIGNRWWIVTDIIGTAKNRGLAWAATEQDVDSVLAYLTGEPEVSTTRRAA